MPRHIEKHQLRTAKEENVDRLAQYLGIDTTGLNKEEMIEEVFIRLLSEQTLSMNIEPGYIVRDRWRNKPIGDGIIF